MTKESLIINCLNATNILKEKGMFESNLDKKLVKLFENVIDFKRNSNFISINDTDGEILTSLNESNSVGLVNGYTKQNPDEIIKINRNNIYAYLNKINESFDNQNEDMVMLFESVDSMKEIRQILNLIITKLSKQNDFQNITNNTVLNIKMFKKDINVFGFNVFDIETINEFRDKKIHYILYNKDNDSIVVLCDGQMHTYYIKTDYLIDNIYSYYDNVYYNVPYTNNFKAVENTLKEFFRGDLKTLYKDNVYFKDENAVFNNVFNDTRNTEILKAHLDKQKAENKSVKNNYNNGYLTR